MEISVTLFGGLRHFLPAGSSFNKCKIDIDDGDSLQALLDRIPVPADEPYLVLLNDEKVSVESVHTDTDKRTMKAEMKLTIAVPGLPTLSRVIDRITQLPNVTSVRRNA